jgi:hypothetical protein
MLILLFSSFFGFLGLCMVQSARAVHYVLDQRIEPTMHPSDCPKRGKRPRAPGVRMALTIDAFGRSDSDALTTMVPSSV